MEKRNTSHSLYGGNMYAILVYDIAKEDMGRKRWNNVFKLCKQYLVHVQNSVFEGEITKANLFKLEKEIENEIDNELDSVIIFKSRHERWLDKEILGKGIEDPLFI